MNNDDNAATMQFIIKLIQRPRMMMKSNNTAIMHIIIRSIWIPRMMINGNNAAIMHIFIRFIRDQIEPLPLLIEELSH